MAFEHPPNGSNYIPPPRELASTIRSNSDTASELDTSVNLSNILYSVGISQKSVTPFILSFSIWDVAGT